MLVGDLWLHSAPAQSVSRDDDFAFNVDALLLQVVVIFGDAVVDVHQRRGDVPTGRVCVVSGKLSFIEGVLVLGDDRLFQRRFELGRRDQLQVARRGGRQQRFEFFDGSVEAPASQKGQQIFGSF